jgi:hypothetical protein
VNQPDILLKLVILQYFRSLQQGRGSRHVVVSPWRRHSLASRREDVFAEGSVVMVCHQHWLVVVLSSNDRYQVSLRLPSPLKILAEGLHADEFVSLFEVFHQRSELIRLLNGILPDKLHGSVGDWEPGFHFSS